MKDALAYTAANREKFLNELLAWLSIPSVSTDQAFKDDCQRAAEWCADNMRAMGLENVAVLPTGGHPVVYGDWLHAGADKPTVLVYGHYDVQPAVMEDGWTHPPFEPIVRDGKIYARGATDDKGLVMCQLKAMEALLATGGAPVNVKYLIEGEEESGSQNLQRFISNNLDKLKADICLISDTGMKSASEPLLIYGLRGLVTMELTVSGPKHDLHSGIGGILHNPAQALCEIIAKLHNPDGSVNVAGFYDDVQPVSDEERAMLNLSNYSRQDWEERMGDLPEWGEAGYTMIERTSIRPTLEINGIAGGYAGEGFKTVIGATARAKISCRLVPNQDPFKIFELVKAEIERITPPTVRSTLKLHDTGYPAITPTDHPAARAAVEAFKYHWETPALFARMGGSIPVVAEFQKQLNLPVILMGFGLPDSAAHGPDESFHVEMYDKGIDTLVVYFHELAK